MNRQPLDSLKGIGEKTGRLFAKLGIETVDELLEYYPRAYDACEEPVEIDSALVSAQTRHRLYRCNRPVEMPKDKIGRAHV